MSSTSRSFEYLEGLPGTTFNRLYKQPSTALAIFRRMLPHLGKLRRAVFLYLGKKNLFDSQWTLAKSFVMALLYISSPLPVADLEAWVRPDGRRYGQQLRSSIMF